MISLRAPTLVLLCGSLLCSCASDPYPYDDDLVEQRWTAFEQAQRSGNPASAIAAAAALPHDDLVNAMESSNTYHEGEYFARRNRVMTANAEQEKPSNPYSVDGISIPVPDPVIDNAPVSDAHTVISAMRGGKARIVGTTFTEKDSSASESFNLADLDPIGVRIIQSQRGSYTVNVESSPGRDAICVQSFYNSYLVREDRFARWGFTFEKTREDAERFATALKYSIIKAGGQTPAF